MMGQRWIRSGFWLFAGAHLVLWTAIPLMIQPNPPLDAVEIVAWGHEWRLKRAILGCALFALVNVLLPLAEGVCGPYVLGNGDRTHFPGQLLAERVIEVWRERHDAPLQLVGGERWLTDNVSFWAPSRPSIFTNGGLRTSTLDEAACPWTSVADFRKRGGVLVWPIGRDGAAFPYELIKHFPDAEVLPPLRLPYETGAALAPVEVGLAVVAPHSTLAPASKRAARRGDSP